MTTRFPKARFNKDSGPASLFERVRSKFSTKRALKTHSTHLIERCARRHIPMEAIEDFSPAEWELMTVEIRTDTGKFVNSAWRRPYRESFPWIVIGFNDTVETAIIKDENGSGPIIDRGNALYSFVESVNTKLIEQDKYPTNASTLSATSTPK